MARFAQRNQERWLFKICERKYSSCEFPKISIIVRHPASFFGGAFRERHDT
jgi:hypothetical protein